MCVLGGEGGEGVHVKGEEAESGVAMETIVSASPVIGAAGMSMDLLFPSLFNTSDTSAVTGHTHERAQHKGSFMPHYHLHPASQIVPRREKSSFPSLRLRVNARGGVQVI